MERTAVESRSLRSVAYDASSGTLEVEFCSGRIYAYADVPREAYEWLMRSPGKGGYFNRMIRDRYVMRDVTPVPDDSDLGARLRQSLDET
jgi:hypothetical protein